MPLLILAALCPTVEPAVQTTRVRNPNDERPNIVFMLSDDQAWNGLSVAMHPDLESSKGAGLRTPNLERLASQGLRFSAAYAPAPVCSPTRISIQTGKNPARLHWTKAAPPVAGMKLVEPRLIKNIPPQESTIAELLRTAGYATAHFGKWHLGGGGPGEHGYDAHDGDTGNEQAYKFKDPNPVDIFGMAERAEQFMARSIRAGKPFFVQLSWNALHASENARRATLERYRREWNGQNEKAIARAAMTEELDDGVGRVLSAVDRLGAAENTYVIYTSDNGAGGGSKRGALRGGKGGVWEGGIRVPLIVRGPGVAPGSWCHVRVVGYDWLPTFCEWARVPHDQLPSHLDGGSLVNLLARGGGSVNRDRTTLLFHFPHYQGPDGPHTAVISGDWKLFRFYEDDRLELYDLANDVSERQNLAAKMPQKAAELRRELEAQLTALDAQSPTLNSEFTGDGQAKPSKRGGKNRGTSKSQD